MKSVRWKIACAQSHPLILSPLTASPSVISPLLGASTSSSLWMSPTSVTSITSNKTSASLSDSLSLASPATPVVASPAPTVLPVKNLLGEFQSSSGPTSETSRSVGVEPSRAEGVASSHFGPTSSALHHAELPQGNRPDFMASFLNIFNWR